MFKSRHNSSNLWRTLSSPSSDSPILRRFSQQSSSLDSRQWLADTLASCSHTHNTHKTHRLNGPVAGKRATCFEGIATEGGPPAKACTRTARVLNWVSVDLLTRHDGTVKKKKVLKKMKRLKTWNWRRIRSSGWNFSARSRRLPWRIVSANS